MDKSFSKLDGDSNDMNNSNGYNSEVVVEPEKSGAMSSEFDTDLMNQFRYKEVLNVKLGLIVPHREFASAETFEKFKSELMKERVVEFLSERLDIQKIKFNIVDLEIVSEATATMIDEVITNDYLVNTSYYHPTTMSVAIDIGSYSTDFISMTGVDIINDSEKRLNIGVDDLLIEIMNKIEDKFDLPLETLDMDNIASSLRYSTVYCENCGTITNNRAIECKCGGTYIEKNNIIRVGKRGFDVSDIVDECVENISKKILEFFSTYVRRIFRLKGVAFNQLENITLSGGGAEIIGDNLKGKLEKELGNLVIVKKSAKAVRKNVDGLAKLIYHNDRNREDVDLYVAVDVGCSAVKSKILDVHGREVIKGIEIPSKVAEPVKMATYKIRKVKPLWDLHVNISSNSGGIGIGEGEYFVGHLASKGEGQTRQSNFTDKKDDAVFYTLVYTSIATLISRLKYKIKND